MPSPGRVLLIGVCLLLGAARARGREPRAAPPGEAGWREAMARVHARFGGRPGTFAQFGDSITVSLAFWSPLRHDRKNASPEMERAYRLVEKRLRPECWRDWKGPEFGNDGGRTIRWADENVDDLAREAQPGGGADHVRHQRPDRPASWTNTGTSCGPSSGAAWTTGRS